MLDYLLPLACLLVSGLDSGERLSPGETARVLAGQHHAVFGADDARAALLAEYARETQGAWSRYEQAIGTPMAAWAATNLERTPGETIFYPFSGPDFVTVHRLYPDAGRYVLVAIQPAGRLPDLAALPAPRLKALLDLFGEGMSNFARRGYFITGELNQEFVPGDVVDGVLGVLLVFAEREGFEVTSVAPVHVGDDGADLVSHPGDPAAKGTWGSTRLVLKRRSDGRQVLLDYARVDLRDQNLRRDKAARAWVERLCAHRVLLKAASHLLQTRGFQDLKAMLLARATTVLQDDAGLDYDDLASTFDVRLFGRLKGSNRSFVDKNYQTSLLRAYQAARGVPTIPFRFGYEKSAGTAIQYGSRPTRTE